MPHPNGMIALCPRNLTEADQVQRVGLPSSTTISNILRFTVARSIRNESLRQGYAALALLQHVIWCLNILNMPLSRKGLTPLER